MTLWEMYTFGELPYGEMAGAQVSHKEWEIVRLLPIGGFCTD